ncbi:MAG: protein kinase, partial [Terracidiphilus sp.]
MSTSVIRADWAGRVINGRFTLRQWLGGSESSGVFLTELAGDPPQRAAIKLIPADVRDAEARMAGWAAATVLSHPHLMRLFHSGSCRIDDTDLLYAVTECAGENLGEIVPERPLTVAETRAMLGPVLDALSYLHEKGYAHGHVKPSNIMVVNDQLKLSVDGVYLSGRLWKHLPTPGVYDAPETATRMSPAADMWSLGVTLVESLTQQLPSRERSGAPDPMVPESMPQPFAGIARACLRRDPEMRCAVEDVRARLTPPPEPAPKLPASARIAEKLAPGRFPVSAIIVAVVVLLAVLAFWRFSAHRSASAPEPAAAAAPEASPAAAPESAQDQKPPAAVPPAPVAAPAPHSAARPIPQPASGPVLDQAGTGAVVERVM